MKGQLSEADKLRFKRGQLTQELIFHSLDEKQWQKVYDKRERLNDEIEKLEGKK